MIKTHRPLFTLEYFDNVIFNGLNYSLPSDVIHRIQNLQKELGISETNNTPRVYENEKKPFKDNYSWKTPPIDDFKPSQIVQY